MVVLSEITAALRRIIHTADKLVVSAATSAEFYL